MTLLDIPPSNFLPEAIRLFDYSLFSKINGKWHTPFLDNFMPFIREPFVWMPLYFFLILFAVINFKIKGAYWVLFMLANAGLSDFVSSNLIKGNFPRLRPCRDPFIADTVRFIVDYCPFSSSFTSSHAVNHFAAAMFIFTTCKKVISYQFAWFFAWAFCISYAQVYVGVHFPFDVFCGAIVGIIVGFIPATIFNKKIGLLPSLKN